MFFKNLWSGVKKIFGIILGVLAALLTIRIIKEVAQIGKVERKKNWATINETSIAVLNEDGSLKQELRLPKDPKTKKQIKVTDIEAVGVSKGGEINVEVKHNIINRRSRYISIGK